MDKLKRAARLSLQGLSLLLFGLILWWAGPEVWEKILDSNWRMLILAFLIYGMVGVVSALRLRVVARALSRDDVGSRRTFYYLSMTARVLGLVLPRGISTLGGKSVGLRALGISLRRSVWIVLMDNVYDILSLGIAALPAVLFLQDQLSPGLFALLTLFLLVALGFGLWRMVSNRSLVTKLHRLINLSPWLSRKLQLDHNTTTFFPRAAPALNAFLHTVVLNTLLIATYFVISQALDLPTSVWLLAAAFPITQLSLIVAIAPGGLGIFDLGWLGLLRLGGMASEDALTFVIAQRAFTFVFVLIWAASSSLLMITEQNRRRPRVHGDGSLHS